MIHKFDRGNCLDEWAGFLKIPSYNDNTCLRGRVLINEQL